MELTWRARWRQWLLCPILLAALYAPLVKREYRGAPGPPRSWPDTLLLLLVSALVALVMYVRGSARVPLYAGLTRRERRIVDDALRARTRPDDALLGVVSNDRAAQLMRRSARRGRRAVAALAGVALVAAFADTWWAAALWLLPFLWAAGLHRNADRLGDLGRAYLAKQSGLLDPNVTLALQRPEPLRSEKSAPAADGADAAAAPSGARSTSSAADPRALIDVRGTERGRVLTEELARELHKRHPLARRSWTVIAEAAAQDDVLAVAGDEAVLVQLTWKPETLPSWPRWQPCATPPGFGTLAASPPKGAAWATGRMV